MLQEVLRRGGDRGRPTSVCSFLIFVLSSLIRLSVPISRGTVTGQRNSRTRTIASRSIILKMWPKKPDEKAEDFAYADDPEFSTIRRKLARWASDNVRIIKDLKPPQPPGLNNRLSANWKLLLQIAQHAGGGWPEQACRSAIYLSRAPYEPSVGVQLLAVLRSMFTKNRTEITSEQVVQELVAFPDSPWHEYRGRGPVTKNQAAALLRDYDIRPVVVHPTKRADFSRH